MLFKVALLMDALPPAARTTQFVDCGLQSSLLVVLYYSTSNLYVVQ